MSKYAEVILRKVSPGIDKVYCYSIPFELKDLSLVGTQVRVPFGRRQDIGYIVGLIDKPPIPKEKIKDIISVTSPYPLFNEEVVSLAKWLAEYYSSFFISALRAAMPPGVTRAERRIAAPPKVVKMVMLARSPKEVEAWIKDHKGKAPRQLKTLETLIALGEAIELKKIAKKLKFSHSVFKDLEKKGLVVYKDKCLPRKPYFEVGKEEGEKILASLGKPLPPTPDQKNALDLITKDLDQEKFETILLYGITGSGKTEVYLQAVAHALSLGKSSIVLVPEIALTPQMIERFRDRFQDHLAVIHSHISVRDRYREWVRLSAGEADIVLGTRSAVFAPVRNLGLIVVDEEYEISYKQQQHPMYHAREVAIHRAQVDRAVVILGSATPSLETFYRAQTGEYKLVVLPSRIDHRPLPPVEIVDMREEMAEGRRGILSKRLKEEIVSALSRGEQVILFINRRGFFTFVMCRECGKVVECPSCSVSLIYHSEDKKLRCHHCGFTCEAPIICPSCQSSSIKYFGTGTQRIEEEVAEILPRARILRVDRDTVRKKGSHEAILGAFRERKADVLIGTQMVTKGLDVPTVTMVGVVAADTALHIPDFRSGERTFQLLTQVAGRAGRHKLPGRVIIQTHNPDHYAIKAAAHHDYQSFYNQELAFRKELDYPPFTKLISILVFGASLKNVTQVAEDLKKFVSKRLPKEAQILGPAPAPIPKMRGRYRHQLMVKGKDLDCIRKAVVESLKKVVILNEVRVNVNVEPITMW